MRERQREREKGEGERKVEAGHKLLERGGRSKRREPGPIRTRHACGFLNFVLYPQG